MTDTSVFGVYKMKGSVGIHSVHLFCCLGECSCLLAECVSLAGYTKLYVCTFLLIISSG